MKNIFSSTNINNQSLQRDCLRISELNREQIQI